MSGRLFRHLQSVALGAVEANSAAAGLAEANLV